MQVVFTGEAMSNQNRLKGSRSGKHPLCLMHHLRQPSVFSYSCFLSFCLSVCLSINLSFFLSFLVSVFFLSCFLPSFLAFCPLSFFFRFFRSCLSFFLLLPFCPLSFFYLPFSLSFFLSFSLSFFLSLFLSFYSFLSIYLPFFSKLFLLSSSPPDCVSR